MSLDLSKALEVLPLIISSLSLLLLFVLFFSRKSNSKSDELRRLGEDLKGLRSDVSASLYKVMEQNKSTSETLFHEQRRESKEMGENFSTLRENIRRDMDEIRKENLSSIEGMTKRTKELEVEVSSKLEKIMEMNMQKLDQMRTLVGENLHETLGKSLSESFSVVSKNLESLHDAIGEMRPLGSEVGGLRRLFGDVKTRGVWGEVQLEAILSDMLTPGQYVRNFRPRENSRDVVEFALKLPGKSNNSVFLPIDSKFPREDYERYLDAASTGVKEDAEESLKLLRKRIREEAQDVGGKYINPPLTTDFAILFVPSESMYADVLRLPGFLDEIRSRYKVILSGPTTLGALLSSLQMGFRTLQIEKRSEEVWALFSKIRHDMAKFNDEIVQTQRALDGAVKKVDQIAKRSTQIGSRLESVSLPEEDSLPMADSSHIALEVLSEKDQQ